MGVPTIRAGARAPQRDIPLINRDEDSGKSITEQKNLDPSGVLGVVAGGVTTHILVADVAKTKLFAYKRLASLPDPNPNELEVGRYYYTEADDWEAAKLNSSTSMPFPLGMVDSGTVRIVSGLLTVGPTVRQYTISSKAVVEPGDGNAKAVVAADAVKLGLSFVWGMAITSTHLWVIDVDNNRLVPLDDANYAKRAPGLGFVDLDVLGIKAPRGMYTVSGSIVNILDAYDGTVNPIDLSTGLRAEGRFTLIDWEGNYANIKHGGLWGNSDYLWASDGTPVLKAYWAKSADGQGRNGYSTVKKI